MEAHLEIDDVSKRYARTVAVERLTVHVPRAAVFGLLGPNGAGKTTTIRMIMRITLPDSGEIRLGGKVIDDDLRELIGYLPEERGLYRRMNVLEHLVFLAEVRGLSRLDARRRATEWLERLDLGQKASAKVEELSKGMQQKVQFAGAVIHQPEFVVLDEPFTGLDPIATRQLKDEILAMRTAGTTVLLSTHVLPQAEELCDHICLVNRGRSILQGALEDVRATLTRPALRVVTRAGDGQLAAVPGVAAVRGGNDHRIVEMTPGTSASALIRELANAIALEAVEPLAESLETIFLRAVEADHAVA
jgi:ABC-2 type transport system ATP-binding protein